MAASSGSGIEAVYMDHKHPNDDIYAQNGNGTASATEEDYTSNMPSLPGLVEDDEWSAECHPRTSSTSMDNSINEHNISSDLYGGPCNGVTGNETQAHRVEDREMKRKLIEERIYNPQAMMRKNWTVVFPSIGKTPFSLPWKFSHGK
ncbi:hypothetical protein K440DRAFT_638052 [Wilcoxina mikolae CBS 423.85]|nr:hypothetical protein K440DRAFT_638052 [Wilcoxina mikolae CBS 423.85]